MHVLRYQVVCGIGNHQREIQTLTEHLEVFVDVAVSRYLCLQKLVEDVQQIVPEQSLYRPLGCLNVILLDDCALLRNLITHALYYFDCFKRIPELLRDQFLLLVRREMRQVDHLAFLLVKSLHMPQHILGSGDRLLLPNALVEV